MRLLVVEDEDPENLDAIVDAAKSGKIDPVIGRDIEIDRMIRILNRRGFCV